MVGLSIIITSYQAERTIGRAIRSILNTRRKDAIEIIVVDDCSTDGTRTIVEELRKDNRNIQLYVMPQNTGSPSEPRNYGVRKATGKYITFLDDDDEINIENLLKMVQTADDQQADYCKGYLLCEENGREYEANRLPAVPQGAKQTIQQMIAYQSMTQDYIVKRNVLIENDLKYRGDMKIGEDTIFILSILSVIKNPLYIDNYFLVYHKTPLDIANRSSTQNWRDREVLNQIVAWKTAEEIAKKIGVSYYELRLASAFRNLLLSIVRYSEGVSKDAFMNMHEFATETKRYVKASINLSKRYQDLYDAILSGNYELYCKMAKRRLLITGYDLKFIIPVIPYLNSEYDIKIDEWTGHNTHKEAASRELANWADIIWCEWLLGNAIYFSKIKNKNQRLVIRAHRFELEREFGHMVNYENVDAVFMVGYYYYEQFIKKFSIPREKAKLLSNYVEDCIYSEERTEDYKYHLGLVGILPKRKGFLRGLELLNMLQKENSKYKLYVMGKRPSEVSWINNNPSEKEYYQKCEDYIKANSLENRIVYTGFLERSVLYTDVGYVLSLSDSEFPESFHLAPAEAACAGRIGYLLSWPGVEYIYPSNVICKDIKEIKDRIINANSQTDIYDKESLAFKQYVMENYKMDCFLATLKRYLAQIWIMR